MQLQRKILNCHCFLFLVAFSFICMVIFGMLDEQKCIHTNTIQYVSMKIAWSYAYFLHIMKQCNFMPIVCTSASLFVLCVFTFSFFFYVIRMSLIHYLLEKILFVFSIVFALVLVFCLVINLCVIFLVEWKVEGSSKLRQA